MTIPKFSREEAFLLCEVHAGRYFQPHEGLLWSDVASAIDLYQAADKRGVDGKALIEKLRGLDSQSSRRLCDCISLAWSETSAELTEALRNQGLSITP
jgi:hypothetical protein